MNARFSSSLRAGMKSSALAAATALAFGLSAPVQAQYSYPGTASSSIHAAKINPARAGAPMRNAYGYGGNPSMRPGEACPPGSNCTMHGSSRQPNGGGPAPSEAYGAHESYGYAASSPPAHQAAASATRNATASPVRASSERGALNYGPSQTSNANFRNSVTGKSSGPNVNTTGQQNSFTGPNGTQVNLSGMSSPSITGPNGQKVGTGGPDLNHLGGGYGQQKGSGIKQGMSYSVNGNGSMSGTRTGNAPGMANGGPQFNNGGTAGVSDEADGGNSKVGTYGSSKPNSTGKSTDSSSGSHWYSGLFDWGGSSKPDAGSNSHATPNGGPVDPNAGSDGIDRKSRVKVMVDKPKGNGSKDTADMGPTAGPGEIVSGTGQVVHPGQKKGQDTGGGQGHDSGGSNSGGQNAQGQYIAPSGQDNVKKPKEVGTLKVDYNGKLGVTDPQQNGGH